MKFASTRLIAADIKGMCAAELSILVWLKRSGVDITPTHGVDNIAMAISLVASTRGLSLMPAYAKNMLPWSVVSRPLKGEPPTIELALAYSNSNDSPILKLLLTKLDDLKAQAALKV